MTFRLLWLMCPFVAFIELARTFEVMRGEVSVSLQG
jgi:hypothetical protein